MTRFQQIVPTSVPPHCIRRTKPRNPFSFDIIEGGIILQRASVPKSEFQVFTITFQCIFGFKPVSDHGEL